MNRVGYLVIAALVVALAAYAFWPEAIRAEAVRLRESPPPAAFTVRAPGVEQRVDEKGVRIAGLERPVDGQKVEALWSVIAAISAPKEKVVANVGAGDLAAYGIDGASGIDAGDWRLRWGRSGGLGYVWDGRRVLCVPVAVCDRLDSVAKRLDRQELLIGTIEGIETGELKLERSAQGGWRDRARPDAPSETVRAARLISLIGRLQLQSLVASPAPAAAPLLSFALRTVAPAGEHRLQLFPDGEAAIAVLDALPPQRVEPALVAAWKRTVDDLGREVLLDVDPGALRAEVIHFTGEIGGHPWFGVDRRQASYRPAETDWDLSWSGGRETASEDQLVAVLAQLCDIAVEHAAPGPDPAPPSPLARRFRFVLQDESVVELTIDGDRAWTPRHHGRLVKATPLALLQPAELLDLALVSAPPERVSKVQVQVYDGDAQRAEVLARAEDGAWSRTYSSSSGDGGSSAASGPAKAKVPVDPVAVVRLAKAFCNARAASARLVDDEDRAALDHPACEVCLRLAPKSKGAPSMEIADERDTVPQDRGFAFYRDRDATWRAIDIEGGVSYAVDEDLVDLARHPLDSDLAFPLVPGLVRRIEIARGAAHYALARAGDDKWTVEIPGAAAASSATDPLEVRRLLRALGELRAGSRSPKAEPLLPNKAAAVVTCVMPGAIGDERLTLSLAEPQGGTVEASVDSTSAETAVPPGRVSIPLGSLDEVAPPLSRFARPAPAQ